MTLLMQSPELSKQIQQWGLQDAGFNYNLVAVFGSQSTGKSELLPHVSRGTHAESHYRYIVEQTV